MKQCSWMKLTFTQIMQLVVDETHCIDEPNWMTLSIQLIISYMDKFIFMDEIHYMWNKSHEIMLFA